LRRRIASLVALGAIACAPLLVGVGAARAVPVHRAAVIVEGDGQTHRVVVEFTEDSISGLELLRRAGADPVVYAYSGIGGAVCRLFGVGRDAGPDCLGGTGGDARYWAYFRASAGTTAFRYASVGGGSTSVRDGDVEGWRFGTGAAPTYASIDTILGIAPPPTVPPTTVAVVPPAGGASTSGGAPGGAPGAVPGDPGPAPTGASGPSTLAVVPTGATGEPGGLVDVPPLAARPAAARRAAPSTRDERGPESLIILALGLAGLGGWIVWARWSRRAADAR
jgi:hypothetical protein